MSIEVVVCFVVVVLCVSPCVLCWHTLTFNKKKYSNLMSVRKQNNINGYLCVLEVVLESSFVKKIQRAEKKLSIIQLLIRDATSIILT